MFILNFSDQTQGKHQLRNKAACKYNALFKWEKLNKNKIFLCVFQKQLEIEYKEPKWRACAVFHRCCFGQL